MELVAGRYQILRKIGSGGMGAVYLAKQVGVGNQVALKFLPSHLSDDAQLRQRFEREAALTLQVSHPGAAQLLDSGVDAKGHMYLAFEYVEGEDLSSLLDRVVALSAGEAIELVCKVAETLAFAHGKGVVHRDIKPENIRVRRDLAGLHVKVLDFGIARLMDQVGTQLTVEGGVAGTPRYMAPEQIGAGTVDARTDVYALGLVLFEALTGREAFNRDTTSQLMWAQLNDPVPAIGEVQPMRANDALDAVIARACAKSPEARFQDMPGLIQVLKALSLPVWGPPQAVVRRARTQAPAAQETPRDIVHLPRPGRKTFLQIRASAWLALAVGAVAVALAAAALWVALDQRARPGVAVVDVPGGGVAVPAPIPASPPAQAPAPAVVAAPSTPVADPRAVAAASAPVASTERATGAQTPAANATANAAAPSPKQTSADMPECAQLAVYDTPMTQMTVTQLEQKARGVKYMAPSVIANQLLALKASADSFHPDSRTCLYRSMLIRMVLNESVVLASSPTLWGHTRDAAELERLILEQPLQQDWTLEQRKDVLRQVETNFIANLQKDAPGDDAYWRRLYYGLVFMCEATSEARDKVGAKRVPEGSCLKLKPA